MINDWTRTLRQWRRNRRQAQIADGNAAELRRLVDNGIGVTFLSSFPKSGNTWVRMILSDVFTLRAGKVVPDNLVSHAERIIPDIYYHPIQDRDDAVANDSPVVRQAGVFVKTHEPLEQTDRWLDRRTSRTGTRHVCLFRYPQDALVSYFHHSVRKGSKANRTRRGIDHFCLDHVARWHDCLSGYVTLAETTPQRVFLINYEMMLQSPQSLMESCFRWIPLSVPESEIKWAIENRNFKRLQSKAQSRNATKSTPTFFRTGTSGSGSKELRPATWNRIEAETAELYRRALTLAARPNDDLAAA